MSFYQRYGSFSAFGAAFAGGAPELFPGGPQFLGGDDQAVFYGSNTGFTQGSKNQGYPWTPAPISWQPLAANVWGAITGSNASMADSNFHDQMLAKFNTLLNSFYMAVGNHSSLGYGGDATQQIVSIGNQLKAALQQLIAYTPQPYVAPAPTSIPGAQNLPTAGTASQQPAPYNTTGGISTSTALATGVAAPGSDNTMLYVAIAGGVLVLGGALLFLRKKKSSATAGYRRRRRR